ncbi:aromatase/cyclase [Streptomyces griseorubiginosus]|uniref:aromatase/cyclase n=1 Tax=Streptomyces griseorubiginosus TaxID=67304 RepID=UPI0033CA0289
MAEGRQHRTEHTLVVAAPPGVLYQLVADVTCWPAVFGPSVHVHHLERGERTERFRIWALVGGEVSSWVSRRTLDPVGLRITFRQEHSRPPIASMGGEWLFRALPGDRTEIVLRHDFTAVDDQEETVRWITGALDRNSPEELGALARTAESGHPVDDVVFSFTDTVRLAADVASAYDFVYRADRWADLLPHVSRVRLREATPGVQELEMDTVTADGSAHTTSSVRICEKGQWIAYKQRRTPRLLLGHSGLWTFVDEPGGSSVTARHTVVIDPSAVSEVLGTGTTLDDARAYVRDALGRNSRATLASAAGTTDAPAAR